MPALIRFLRLMMNVKAALQQINNRLITEKEFQYICFVSKATNNTTKSLNLWTPENFVVVSQNFKQAKP